MILRIYRTWKWVPALPMGDVWIGSKPPLRLEPLDELQAKTALGTWLPVPVVEAVKPEHPDALEAREHSEVMREAVHKAIAAGAVPSLYRPRRKPLAWEAARTRINGMSAQGDQDALGGRSNASRQPSKGQS